MLQDSMDTVFQALANPARRRMLDIVRAAPGCSVGELCENFEMSRIGAMKHLRMLEDSGLVTSHKEGRVRRLRVNAVPIQMIYDRWTSEWSALWASEMTGIKYRVESGAVGEVQIDRSDSVATVQQEAS